MLKIGKNNKKEQFILHPDVLSPPWLMYSLRTMQIYLHLIFTGWIPTRNRMNGTQRFYALASLLSNFGSGTDRTPISHELSPALCSHPVNVPVCILNLCTGISHSNLQVLCSAGSQVFYRSAVTMEPGVICKSHFIVVVVSGNTLAGRLQDSLLFTVEFWLWNSAFGIHEMEKWGEKSEQLPSLPLKF